MSETLATAPALQEPQPAQAAVNMVQTGVEQPPRPLVTAMVTYFILLILVLFYLLIKLWPGTVPLPNRSTVTLGWNGRFAIDLWIETRYLLIVVLSGAVGSYIHLATSFADYVGNGKLKSSWKAWYLLRPFIGATLAIVVYFCVREGLINGTGSGAEQLSPHGIAAIAGMCGLFSKQATDKLQAIFEEAFRTKDGVKRADPLATKTDRGA